MRAAFSTGGCGRILSHIEVYVGSIRWPIYWWTSRRPSEWAVQLLLQGFCKVLTTECWPNTCQVLCLGLITICRNTQNDYRNEHENMHGTQTIIV
jgi:hypothetical protein